MKDLFGRAILDFQTNNSPQDLITETTISEADAMSVAYLFRSYDEMPLLEQKALQLAKGKILDVGCGAGSHSLFLQEKGFEVTAVDISENAIQTCKLRGIKQCVRQNVLEIENETFDTILLLMNGTGIFRTIAEAPIYLQKLKTLLRPDGQILIDSSDVIYMFDHNKDGSYQIPDDDYYGELTFTITYKGQTEEPFPWLYLDYDSLQNLAKTNGLQCELLAKGEHFDYLARLF